MVGLKSAKADMVLLATAILWGSGFLGSQLANESGLSPAMILAMRSGIATVLMSLIGWRGMRGLKPRDCLSGLVTGGFLFLGFYLQTAGLRGTSVSNNAFLTTTNVMMVPFIQWVMGKKRPGPKMLWAAALSMAGIWFLTWSPGQGMQFQAGDALSLACAFFYSCHIFCLGLYQDIPAGRFTLMQMAVAACLACLATLVFPAVSTPIQWGKGLSAVFYLGVFPTCLAFFLQTWAQKHAEPAKAAVLLSLEGLFACIFSILLDFEPLTVPLVMGGLILVGAVILSEWPEKTQAATEGME